MITENKIENQTKKVEKLLKSLGVKYSNTTVENIFYALCIVPTLLVYLVLYSTAVIFVDYFRSKETFDKPKLIEYSEPNVDEAIEILGKDFEKVRESINLELQYDGIGVMEVHNIDELRNKLLSK